MRVSRLTFCWPKVGRFRWAADPAWRKLEFQANSAIGTSESTVQWVPWITRQKSMSQRTQRQTRRLTRELSQTEGHEIRAGYLRTKKKKTYFQQLDTDHNKPMKVIHTHSVKIGFWRSVKVYNVPDGLGGANSNIKCINNGLAKVFLHSGRSQATQVDSVEALLVPGNENYPIINTLFRNAWKILILPKVGFIKLFHVQGFIIKGSYVHITSWGEHFT